MQFALCLLETSVFDLSGITSMKKSLQWDHGRFRYSMEHWLYRMLALAAEIWQLLLEGPGMFVVSMVAVCCICY